NHNRKQKRKWNHRSHNHSRSPIVQKDKYDNRNEENSFNNIFCNGVYGCIYEFGSVDKRFYFYIFRKNGIIEFFDFFFQSRNHISRIFSTKHNHNSLYQIVIILKSDLSESRFSCNLNLCNVFYQNRGASTNFNQNIFDVINTFQKSNSTNHISLGTSLNHISSNIDIALGNSLINI